ncbi:MAG TPA: hypothetical protein VEO56_08630 [Bacteroidota bacterium]|nr:hypothetical protein [Bacteroidota bacterium]
MDLQRRSGDDSLLARLRTLRSGVPGKIPWRMILPGAVISAFRMIFKLYPRRYSTDRTLADQVLRAFVLTVIPGADHDDPDLVRMYFDRDYPFYPYTAFLVFDLVRRSKRICAGSTFAELGREERTLVIEKALAANDTVARLYRGAMLMAQVSYYAGIYDPEKGCPLIDFPGMNAGFSRQEISYPNPAQYLPHQMSLDGNPP